MTDFSNKEDELAGTEQPFVQHLMELRDRLIYCLAGLGVCMALLAIWPSPSGLIANSSPVERFVSFPATRSTVNSSPVQIVSMSRFVDSMGTKYPPFTQFR